MEWETKNSRYVYFSKTNKNYFNHATQHQPTYLKTKETAGE